MNNQWSENGYRKSVIWLKGETNTKVLRISSIIKYSYHEQRKLGISEVKLKSKA